MNVSSGVTFLFAWVLLFQGPDPVIVAASVTNQNSGKLRVIREVIAASNETQDEKCLPNSSPCVSICCQPGWYYEGSKCIYNSTSPANDLQFPQIHNDDLQPLNETVNDFNHVYHTPCKYGNSFLQPEIHEDMFYFLENGSLYLPNCFDGKMYGVDEYCLASKLQANGSVTKIVICGEEQRSDDLLFLLYPVTMMISVPFLIATIIVYSVVSELRNLHGLCLRIQMTILTLIFILLIVLMLIDIEPLKRTVLCEILAVIDYFLYLGNFFWLNVLCIDMWLTFGGFSSKMKVRQKDGDRKRFMIYSLYAWGCISLLTGICTAMDYIPKDVMSIIPRPEFGIDRCWFRTRTATAVYFYVPVGLTILSNISFFISIAVNIVRHERYTARHLKNTDSMRHDEHKQRFHICLKLLVVMGLNWSMEIISWAAGDKPPILWTIIDMGNTLQGVILFFLLVWNARVKKLLLKRFGWHDENALSSTHTSTSTISEQPNKCSDSEVPNRCTAPKEDVGA